jgi:hypothetical protein
VVLFGTGSMRRSAPEALESTAAAGVKFGGRFTRDNRLRDIATVNDMLKETLTYLREGGQQEPAHLVDLPSLLQLQIICAEFTDVGHEVPYEGLDRFTFA